MVKKKVKSNPATKYSDHRLTFTPKELKLLEQRELWDRQEGESQYAYDLFIGYRDMQRRNMLELCRLHDINKNTIYRYSLTHEWTARASAWDNYVQRRKDQAKLKAIDEMTERHAKHAQALENSFMYPVQELVKALGDINKNDFKDMSAKELYAIVLQMADRLPKIIDIERKSRGVPNDYNQTSIDLTSAGEAVRPMINILVKGSQSQLIDGDDGNYSNDRAE